MKKFPLPLYMTNLIVHSARSLLDATYFVFISITTIGLGDYIPGDSLSHMEYRDVYKTVVGLFLLFGLVLTSLTLTIFYDIPQVSKQKCEVFEYYSTQLKVEKLSEMEQKTKMNDKSINMVCPHHILQVICPV